MLFLINWHVIYCTCLINALGKTVAPVQCLPIHRWLDLHFFFSSAFSWLRIPGLDPKWEENEKGPVIKLRHALDSLKTLQYCAFKLHTFLPHKPLPSLLPPSSQPLITETRQSFQHSNHKLQTHGHHDKIPCLLLSKPSLFNSQIVMLQVGAGLPLRGAC